MSNTNEAERVRPGLDPSPELDPSGTLCDHLWDIAKGKVPPNAQVLRYRQEKYSNAGWPGWKQYNAWVTLPADHGTTTRIFVQGIMRPEGNPNGTSSITCGVDTYYYDPEGVRRVLRDDRVELNPGTGVSTVWSNVDPAGQNSLWHIGIGPGTPRVDLSSEDYQRAQQIVYGPGGIESTVRGVFDA